MKNIKFTLILLALLLLLTSASVSYARDFSGQTSLFPHGPQQRKRPTPPPPSPTPTATPAIPPVTFVPVAPIYNTSASTTAATSSAASVATSTRATSTPILGSVSDSTSIPSPAPKSGSYLSLHTTASANDYYQSSAFSGGATRVLLAMSGISALAGFGLIGIKKWNMRQPTAL